MFFTYLNFLSVPPRTVSINVKPKKLKEGERAYLTCESSSSNPPAKVVWQRNGIHIPAHTNSTKDGVYGGKKTVTTLELNLTSELDNVAYTCQATNSAIKKSVHDGVTLQVLCKQDFLKSTFSICIDSVYNFSCLSCWQRTFIFLNLKYFTRYINDID